MQLTEKKAFLFLSGNQVGFSPEEMGKEDALTVISKLRNAGIGAIILYHCSNGDHEHEAAIHTMKEMIKSCDISFYVGGDVWRFEDIKKYLYTGARMVYCDNKSEQEMAAYEEGVKRFGEEKVKLCAMSDIVLGLQEGKTLDEMELPTETFSVNFSWADVKTNPQGLLPVVTQDDRTNEVLMVAYMNEEAFDKTIETGRMTYFSRSRNELWVKGLTSGNFQYVKSLYLDCDNDTLLAKVYPVGPACHTGANSCFFKTVLEKPTTAINPHKVLENVMGVILDRKENPKEGSYTNYLFDKGIDKILKKVGEEATEIVIAAKNPDAEEIKYEISDFLYHVMVLMAARGVSWDDVMVELANR